MVKYSKLDDVGHIFSEIETPEVDLTGRIMQQIRNKTENRKNGLKFRKLVTAILCISLLMFLGDVFKVKPIAYIIDKINIIDRINNLKPGEGIIIKSEDKLEQPLTLNKPFLVKDLEVLKKEVGKNYFTIGNLPRGFEFTEAYIPYEAIKPMEVPQYTAKYKLDEKKITLKVHKGMNWRLRYYNVEEKEAYSVSEDIQLNGDAGIFRIYSYEDNNFLVYENGIAGSVDLGGYKQIVWIYNNEYYMTLTFSDNIRLNKEEMIAIAESVKPSTPGALLGTL